MTNKELDKWLAIWMGYTWIDKLHVKDKDGNYIVDGKPWSPTKDLNQIAECEKNLSTNKRIEYTKKLIDSVCLYGFIPQNTLAFELNRTSAEQRAQAIYQACKEEDMESKSTIKRKVDQMKRPTPEDFRDSIVGALRYSTAQDKYINFLESRLAQIAEITENNSF